MFCHYPIYNIDHEYNIQRNNKIIERMEILKEIADSYESGLFNIHGHLHSACPKGSEKSLNVCIDFNKFKILDFFKAYAKVGLIG
jgi:calcineurin-like phosphoesterase family protein